MSILLPASKYYKNINQVTEDNTRVYVFDQNGFNVITKKPGLVIGNVIKFVEGVTGLVVAINADNTTIRLMENTSVTYGYVEPIISIPPVNYKVIDSSIPIGLLSAVCVVSPNHQPGLLGWSLYKDDSLIAVGNDLNNPATCSLSGTSNWLAGVYVLSTRLFQKPIRSPIGYARKTWVADKPTPKLSCGNYDDKDNKIIF